MTSLCTYVWVWKSSTYSTVKGYGLKKDELRRSLAIPVESLYAVDDETSERNGGRKAPTYDVRRCGGHENTKEKVKRSQGGRWGAAWIWNMREKSEQTRSRSFLFALSASFSVLPPVRLPALLPCSRAPCKILPRGNDGSSFGPGNGDSFRSRKREWKSEREKEREWASLLTSARRKLADKQPRVQYHLSTFVQSRTTASNFAV